MKTQTAKKSGASQRGGGPEVEESTSGIPSTIDWVRERLEVQLPHHVKLTVLQHPEKERIIEVLVDDGQEVIRGVLYKDRVEALRVLSEDGLHESFFEDFLKPFFKLGEA